MTTLSALIAALEKAMRPDRELDRQIGEAVGAEMGLSGDVVGLGYARYTESLDAALMLVPEGYVFATGDCSEEDEAWGCVTAPDPDNRDFDCRSAATPTIALCIAALKARQS